jgi:glucose-1-phosphate cytidylyltransferase
MKVVILAGGMGTRLSEETDMKPKPMVEIGGKPILWHIMKIYSYYGFNDFIICLGYKSYIIKEYFHHYFLHYADVTIDLENNKIEYHSSKAEPWKITLVETGLHTQTGGRIKRVQKYIGNNTFMLTYGDGVGNIDISKLVEHHKKTGKYATLTAIQPSGRFGALGLDQDHNVTAFQEKPQGEGGWVNAGFFVLEPQVFDYITRGDETVWEQEPLTRLSKDRQLNAYMHHEFWRPMDALRDKNELESLWNSGKAQWKIWD